MIKTHKIKIYPNKTMLKEINTLFNYRRYIWNQALGLWNDMYDESVILEDKKLSGKHLPMELSRLNVTLLYLKTKMGRYLMLIRLVLYTRDTKIQLGLVPDTTLSYRTVLN